jgi:hypothetical protein
VHRDLAQKMFMRWLLVRLKKLAFPQTSSSEMLSTLSRSLGAVGLVTGQPTAVGGDKGIDEVLQMPDAR